MNIETSDEERNTFRAELTKFRADYKELSEVIRKHKAIMRASCYQPTYREHRILNQLKSCARHKLLAFGLVRGLDYKVMENNCDPTNSPDAELILNYIELDFPSQEWTNEQVKAKL